MKSQLVRYDTYVVIYCQQSVCRRVWTLSRLFKRNPWNGLWVVSHVRRFKMYELERDYFLCSWKELNANLKQENWKVNLTQKWSCNLNSLFEISSIFPMHGTIVFSSCLSDFMQWPPGMSTLTLDWAVCVLGDIVLCSWARHFTLTVPLSTQMYKWVLVNIMLQVTLRWTNIPSRGE